MSSFSLATDRYRLSSDAALAAHPMLFVSSVLPSGLEHYIIHATPLTQTLQSYCATCPTRFRRKLVFIYLSIVCFFLLPCGRRLVDIFSFNTLGFSHFFSFTLTRIMARIQLAYLTCTFLLLALFFSCVYSNHVRCVSYFSPQCSYNSIGASVLLVIE